MTKRYMKDPSTREIIGIIKSCKLMKDCNRCESSECIADYRGTVAVRMDRVVNTARIREIQILDKRGWSKYGICLLLRVSEQLVEEALGDK